MKSINFKTCELTEYAINGDESTPIRINLRDVNLKKRIEDAGPRITEIMEKYDDIRTPEDAIAADAEIRTVINDVFGTDVCTPAFGGTNCLTKVDALPLCAHFFRSFCEMIVEDLTTLAAQNPPANNPKVEKYTAPVITRKQPLAPLVNPTGAIDVSGLSDEQKTALLKQLLSYHD